MNEIVRIPVDVDSLAKDGLMESLASGNEAMVRSALSELMATGVERNTAFRVAISRAVQLLNIKGVN